MNNNEIERKTRSEPQEAMIPIRREISEPVQHENTVPISPSQTEFSGPQRAEAPKSPSKLSVAAEPYKRNSSKNATLEESPGKQALSSKKDELNVTAKAYIPKVKSNSPLVSGTSFVPYAMPGNPAMYQNVLLLPSPQPMAGQMIGIPLQYANNYYMPPQGEARLFDVIRHNANNDNASGFWCNARARIFSSMY